MTVLLAGRPRTFRRYEANPGDADAACFTFPIAVQPNENFEVSYNITSEDILVHMNLRSTVDNRLIQSRLLPTRFRRLYEKCDDLTEPYDIEFCASTETAADNRHVSKDASTPSAVIFDVFRKSMSGSYPLMLYASFFKNKCCALRSFWCQN